MGRSLKQTRIGMIVVETSDLARRHRDDPIALGYELGDNWATRPTEISRERRTRSSGNSA